MGVRSHMESGIAPLIADAISCSPKTVKVHNVGQAAILHPLPIALIRAGEVQYTASALCHVSCFPHI